MDDEKGHDRRKDHDQRLIQSAAKKEARHQPIAEVLYSMAREIIRLREANERLHEKLGETIDECSALRYKLDQALGD